MNRRGSPTSSRPKAPPQRPVAIAAALAAVVAATVFAMLLATQRVSSSDIGYHLAYGERFWATLKPVDANEFIYTLPRGHAEALQAPPGPGCWYDLQGRYRFANANWLSQAIMAALWRLGGMAAMSLLGPACMGAILVLIVASLRRMGIGWLALAAGVVAIALAGAARLAPRPELIAYPILVAQLCLLLDAVEGRRGLSLGRAAALVLLQWVLVNTHSYFLLGLAMTAAMLVDRLLRLLWWRGQGQIADSAMGADARRLAAVLAAQAAACLVNPWTWRLAVMPVQTLWFLREHRISATQFPTDRHPWSVIAEFTNTPAALGSANFAAAWPIVAVLALAAVAALMALARRRWGLAMILAGAVAVGLSMVRNTAVASLLAVPTALAALRPVRAGAGGRGAWARRASVVVAAGVALLSVWWSVEVVTHRFHHSRGWADRFGIGPARLHLPLGAVAWLNEHQPVGRMWTDFNCSSNLYYFSRPHRDVPILTNTWAYPPRVMLMVLNHLAGAPFDQMVSRYGIEVAAMEVGLTNEAMVRDLAGDRRWRIVYLDAAHIIFLRADGANSELASRCGLVPATFDVSAYVGAAAQLDPLPQVAIDRAALTLRRIGWTDQARQALAFDRGLGP